MARFKPIDMSPKLIPVDFARQILPGSFEYALCHLIDLERLAREAARVRDWLKAHPKDRPGARGAIRKSNLTDNDSAKMATAKGVIQGYTGVAAVDERAQIIVEAQAHGVRFPRFDGHFW
jgi:hypothetical protein